MITCEQTWLNHEKDDEETWSQMNVSRNLVSAQNTHQRRSCTGIPDRRPV